MLFFGCGCGVFWLGCVLVLTLVGFFWLLRYFVVCEFTVHNSNEIINLLYVNEFISCVVESSFLYF